MPGPGALPLELVVVLEEVVVELLDELELLLVEPVELVLEPVELDDPVVEEGDPEVEVEVEDEVRPPVMDEVVDDDGVELVVELPDELVELEDELLELDEDEDPHTIGSVAAVEAGGTFACAPANALMMSTTVGSGATETVVPSNVTVQPASADAAGSAARPHSTIRPASVARTRRSLVLGFTALLGRASRVRTPSK